MIDFYKDVTGLDFYKDIPARELFEERAAILESECRYSREYAEKIAFEMIKKLKGGK
jgi:hypothetical protein